MLGTIVNTGAIIAGSLLGLLLKGGIPKRFDHIIMQAMALSVLCVGISGSLKSEQTLLMIISLVVGGIIGEALDIDKALNKLGQKLEDSMGKGNIAKGFISASLLFCVGSMAIVGSIQSGLEGKHDLLFIKSMMDGIVAILYTSTMGIGVIFSAAAIFIYQGTITLAAVFLGSVLAESQITDIGAIGSVLIIALGLNMLKITEIKVANLLPAVFIPMLYYIVSGLI